MKTTMLFLICGFTVFGVHAQSKKVINQQLIAEFAAVQKTTDSITLVHNNKQRGNQQSPGIGDCGKEKIRAIKNEEMLVRQRIDSKQLALKEIPFDGYSIVSYAEVKSLVSPAAGKDYSTEPAWYAQKMVLLNTPLVQDLTDMKIKAQNEVLKSEIAAFRAANSKNRVLLVEEQQIVDNFNSTINELNTLSDNYSVFNKTLNDKYILLKNKYDEEIEKKQAAERLKREKEVLAASKSKSKNPKTIPFVPPVVMDEYVDEVPPSRYSKDMESGDEFKEGDFFEVPEPMPESPKPASELMIYDVVEEEAQFPGGREALKKYLDANLKMPAVAEELGLSGKCYLRFVISTTGNISNITVKRGVADCPECDKEAIRVVKNMPNWIPAKNNGKAVNCWYNFPVEFKVQ